MEQYHGTTILSVRRGTQAAMGGDGQVTLGNIVIKSTARKVRRLYQERHLGWFRRWRYSPTFSPCSSVSRPSWKNTRAIWSVPPELAKDWRTDRMLRRLEAMLAVADRT